MSGYFHYKNDALYAEQVPLADIAKQFGTPCYVYSRAALTDGLGQFTNALRGHDHLICYAVKANSNLAILNLFARLGAGFDIVSGGELKRALAAGADPQKIVFSGVGKSADEKHLQIYLTDSGLQADMVAVGWSGAIDPPEGTTDLLAVSNAVVTPSKANLGVSKSIDYRVQIAPDGSASTTLTLGYNKARVMVPGLAEETLANYVRAHRLPGAQLAPASKSPFDSVDDLSGLPTFGHYFQLKRGSTTVVLNTTIPQVLGQSSPVREGTDWHYRLLMAKQSDLVETKATASITIPPGWRVTGSSAWFRVTGQSVATSADTTTVTVATPLSEDLVLDVALSPA
ncbi:MAG: hypothetical protein ABI645_15280 [Pseudomonadota bacterium]